MDNNNKTSHKLTLAYNPHAVTSKVRKFPVLKNGRLSDFIHRKIGD